MSITMQWDFPWTLSAREQSPPPARWEGSPARRPAAVLMDIGMTLIHPSGRTMLEELRVAVPGHPADARDCAAALVVAAEARHLPLPRELGGDEKVGSAWGALLGLDQATALRVWQRLAARHDLYSELDHEAEALLSGLHHRGIRIAAVSNGVGALDEELEHYGIAGYFDVALDSAAFAAEKPAPEMFHAACAAVATPPQNCWFLGDGLVNDVLGARAAGIGTAVLYDRFGVHTAVPGINRISHLTQVFQEL